MAEEGLSEKELERILLNVRGELLREVLRKEPDLDRLYRKKILKLQRLIKDEGLGEAPDVVKKEIEALTLEVSPIIRDLIEKGALAGRRAARRSLLRLFGGDTRVKFATEEELLAEASQAIRSETLVEHAIELSERVWYNSHALGELMARLITHDIEAGSTLNEIAGDLLGLDEPDIELSEYITQIFEAAHEGGREFEKAVERHLPQIDKLGSAAGPEFTIKPAVKRFIEALPGATHAQINQHLQTYVGERALYQTKMIARSESIEAYKAGYRKSVEGQPWLKGYRWSLGDNHPEPDECDLLAGQDLYGLGPGGYPSDSLPQTPHPNDMCVQVAIIDKDHFKRKRAKRNKEPEPPTPWLSGKKETSAGWLRKQDPETQRSILGPTRYKIFKSNKSFADAGGILGTDGVPHKVSDVVKMFESWGDGGIGRGFSQKPETIKGATPQRYVKVRGEPQDAVRLIPSEQRAATEDFLRESVDQAGGLQECIDAFKQSGLDTLYVGDVAVPTKDLVRVLEGWRPPKLPKNAETVTVLHATDRKTAERMLKDGVIPQLKPWTLTQRKFAAGKAEGFDPKAGLERGLYVAKQGKTSLQQLKAWAGRGGTVLEIDVPRSWLEVPAELKGRGTNDIGEAIVKRAIPAGRIHEVVERPKSVLGPVEAKTSYEAMATWGGGQPVLKSGMTVEQAEAAICNEPIEHCYVVDKKGQTVARLTSGHEDKVRPSPKEDMAVESRNSYSRRMRYKEFGDDYRPEGAPYLYTHNHPPYIDESRHLRIDYPHLSPGDFEQAMDWNVHEFHSVSPTKKWSAKMVITDEGKWIESTRGLTMSPVFKEIDKATAETQDVARKRFLEGRDRPDGKAYNDFMMRTLHRKFNQIGRKYGFRYELFTRP